MYELGLLVSVLLAFGYYTYLILRGENVFTKDDREAHAGRPKLASTRSPSGRG
jgi:hypothetical protein